LIEAFVRPFALFRETTRDAQHRDRVAMKTPVALVTVGLTVAILLAASLLIATGTRGEDEPSLLTGAPLTSPSTR
jgi:hypothetical protein